MKIMSDAVIISIVSGFFTLATLIVTAIINKKVNVVKTEVTDVKSNVVEQAVKVAAVVEKVDEVKSVITEQVQKSENIVGAVDGYHKEVNGNMKILLEKTEALAKAEQKIENHKT